MGVYFSKCLKKKDLDDEIEKDISSNNETIEKKILFEPNDSLNESGNLLNCNIISKNKLLTLNLNSEGKNNELSIIFYLFLFFLYKNFII